MDKSYSFKFDENKQLYEQDVLPETKALIIVIYQHYFMKDSEKKLWDKYNRICNKMIEEEKSKNYDVNNIFHKPNQDKVEEKNNW